MKYLTVVLLSVAVFAESMQASTIQASGKDEAKKVLQQLIDAIEKALTQAQNALNDASAKVQAESARIEDQAKTELEKVLAPLREKLNNLVAQAQAKGYDVAACQPYLDSFTKIPDDLVHNLIDCVNQQVQKAQSYVNDALNNARQMEQNAANIDVEIDNCGGNAVKKAKCYAKIIEKIGKALGESPQHILEDTAKATALITQLLPNLETCSVEQLKKSGTDAAEDVANFAICAAV